MTVAGASGLGIVGGGTMGAGIAAAACRAGRRVTLVDVAPAAIERGRATVVSILDKAVARGKLTGAEAAEAKGRLATTTRLEGLAASGLIVEAVPEDRALKADILRRLGELAPRAVLASNTSSIPIGSLAAEVADPTRLIGLHFFNPVHATRLVELVATEDSAAEAVEVGRLAGEAMGKVVLVVADGPGFLVNRCARPYYLEALRLVEEKVAEPAQIDRICRRAGGFPNGPFELMDLIGIDVSLAATESMWEQSGGEPRWRPSPLQVDLVDQGRLGRKSGAGFHDYAGGGPHDLEAAAPAAGGGEGRLVAVGGCGRVAEALRARASRAGFALCDWDDVAAEDAWLAVDAEPEQHLELRDGMAAVGRVRLCACSGLAASGDRRACGFHLIGPVEADVDLVEVTRLESTDPEAAARTDFFFAALGFHRETVGDAPGLVLGRIVAQLVNEARFAVGEGVASPDDVDTGTTLGLNYPRGTFAWGEAAGLPHVGAVLAALRAGPAPDRYRAAPALQFSTSARTE